MSITAVCVVTWKPSDHDEYPRRCYNLSSQEVRKCTHSMAILAYSPLFCPSFSTKVTAVNTVTKGTIAI